MNDALKPPPSTVDPRDGGDERSAAANVPRDGRDERSAAQPSSLRLMGTLALGGAAAGLLLSLVNAWAQPRVEGYRAAVLEAAVHEVLKAPDRQEPLYLIDGRLTAELPDGADPAKLTRVFAGYRGAERVGYAISSSEAGFQDQILVLFGYDPRRGELLGIRVLESRETPGLGDKIEKDAAWVAQFDGARLPMVDVKPGTASPDDRAEIDMITGVTISARTVVRIINNAVERWTPLIQEYEAGGSAQAVPVIAPAPATAQAPAPAGAPW